MNAHAQAHVESSVHYLWVLAPSFTVWACEEKWADSADSPFTVGHLVGLAMDSTDDLMSNYNVLLFADILENKYSNYYYLFKFLSIAELKCWIDL